MLLNGTIGEKFAGEEVEKAIGFVQKKIINVKNYLRLICTHKVMELQDGFYKEAYNDIEKDPREEYVQKVQKTLIDFFKQELLLGESEPSVISRIVKRELLISYLKVISRGYLSYLAPIREAVYRIILELLDCLLWNWGEAFAEGNVDYSKYDAIDSCFAEVLTAAEDKEDYWQIYQLAVTLLKRLCDLQSVVILEYSFFNKWILFVEHLWSKYSSRAGCQKDRKDNILAMAMEDYTMCLKWSVSASEDSGKGILLKNLCDQIRIEEDKKGEGNGN